MAQQNSEEKVVPLGVVFITIGLIVVATAVSILLFQPPVQQTAVSNTPLPVITVVVTPEPNTTATATAEPTDTSTEISLPEGFVSVEEAQAGNLSNQPERIVIPSIEVDAPVVNVGLTAVQTGNQTVYQWQVPEAYEAGWHNTSALLGETGNTVINGHHNIFGEVFGKLVDLEVGADIVVYDADLPHNYSVTDVQILPERDQSMATRLENAQWIQATNDERLTLVTCWPHTDNSHRLIVVAHPTDGDSN